MGIERVDAGIGGLANALDASRLAADVITRSLDPQDANRLSRPDSAGVQTTQLAKAVPGVGGTIDIRV